MAWDLCLWETSVYMHWHEHTHLHTEKIDIRNKPCIKSIFVKIILIQCSVWCPHLCPSISDCSSFSFLHNTALMFSLLSLTYDEPSLCYLWSSANILRTDVTLRVIKNKHLDSNILNKAFIKFATASVDDTQVGMEFNSTLYLFRSWDNRCLRPAMTILGSTVQFHKVSTLQSTFAR